PLQTTVNGVPLCAMSTLAICQPSARVLARPPDGPGIVQFRYADSLCRMSKSDGPSSCAAGPKASGRCGGVIVLEKSIALPIVYAVPNWRAHGFALSAKVPPL